MVVGAGLLVAPFLMGNSPLGKALSSLSILGLLMLGAGALVLWLGKPSSASEKSSAQTQVRPRAQASAMPRSGVARRQSAPDGHQVSQETTDQAATVIGRAAASSRASAESKEAQRPLAAAPVAPPATWDSEVFKVIEWRRFEALVEALFEQAGFQTQSQSHGADEGIDIWLYSRNQPGEPVSLVQCKHWQGRRVGVDKIRELRGVMASRGVKRGQFATTSTFTPDAEAFARANGINLLDVNGLLSLVAQRTPEQQRALLAVALQGDYWRPTCVNCGIKMVNRASRVDGSGFWGCENFPRCRTTMPMRSS